MSDKQTGHSSDDSNGGAEGYRFVFDGNGRVIEVYEVEDGLSEPERIEQNETYTLQPDGTVLKTETHVYGIETKSFLDADGDGLFEESSHSWVQASRGPLEDDARPGGDNGRGRGHDDWYEYAGRYDDHTISRLSDTSVRVTDNRSGSVLDDSLVAQRILFEDRALAFDVNAAAGQAYRLYRAAFDRAPDLSGLGYWISMMDDGVLSLQGVAASFTRSAEFRSLYGSGVRDDEFLDLLYANVLDRIADSSGKAYWMDLLQSGISREEVLLNFSESQENKMAVADLVANGIVYIPHF